MTTNTMVAIAPMQTLGSAAASITFSSIPSTYTDLFVVINGAGNGGTGGNLCLQINGDVNTYTSATRILGDGSSASSARNTTGQSNGIMIGDIASGDKFTAEINIMNYSNTVTYKEVLSRYSGQSYVGAYAGTWSKPSKEAINQIVFTINGGQNFAAGTTAEIYGIANADIGAYATGGIITQDSTYYYHAFGSSGTFTPSRNLTADILVVAGGGGGAGGDGGGAGAGGLLTFASQSLSSGTGYTCTVGAGGAYGTNPGQGSNGGNSSFGAISGTVYGGGGGGYSGSTPSGGSGGGAVGSGSISYSGGAGTSGQGNAGGSNYPNPGYGPAGGGGGAGTAGGNAGPTTGGNGGNGVTSALLNAMALATSTGALDSSSGNYYYAGGGGGWVSGGTVGLGGKGGGGNANTSSAAPATPYTGGGGGAGVPNGGLGGSGVIIVRYLK